MMENLLLKVETSVVILARPTLDVNVPNKSSADTILVNLLDMVYLAAGIAAVIAIIIGGFWYVTSDGNAEKIKRGKNAIIYASVGLVVILLAFGITGFITNRITV